MALSAEPMMALDDRRNIVYLNAAAEQLFDCRSEAVAGAEARELIAHGLPARSCETGESLASAERIARTRAVVRRSDGAELEASLRLVEVEDEGRCLLLVAVETAAVQMPGGAREPAPPWPGDEPYRTIVAVLQEGIVVQDADGRILAFNSSAERILGLSPEQLRERTSIDPRWRAVHEDGSPYPGSEHPAMLALRTGEPQRNVTMGIHHDDGSLVWISINSQPLFTPGDPQPYAVLTSFSDITQARNTEQALRDQGQLLRSVVESMPVGVWIMDETGKIILGNAAGQRVWAGARYVGPEQFGEYKGWWADTGEPIAPDEWAAARAINQRETSIDELIEIECFDGTHKFILNSALPVMDAEGRLAGGIIVNQDITERILAYQLAEQRVAERTREIGALLEVSREMASTLQLEPLLRTVLTQLRSVVAYDGAAIGIVEGDGLRIAEYVGPLPREDMVGQTYSLLESHAYQQVVSGNAPVILADMWAAMPWLEDPGMSAEESPSQGLRSAHSWLGVPLTTKGNVFGVLTLDSASAGSYSEEHARLVSAFAAHAAVAIENARLYESAQRAAALEERQRLARELHDSVSQALYGIALGTRTAQRLLETETDPAGVGKPLVYVLSLAEAAFAEMRALIFELKPDSLESDGLIAALDRQIEALRHRHQITVEADLCDEPRAPISVKEAIYRIVQEATQNIVKHARATRIDICLSVTDHGELLLEILDDGRGFDLEAVPAGHLGLRNMRERCDRLSGRFDIESAPGEGTRVTVWIPLVTVP